MSTLAHQIYAAAHGVPVIHVTEDDTEFVAAIQALLDANGPVEVRYYDTDMDDRRGGSRRVGYYRTRAAGQAEADRLNAEILAKQNAVARSSHAAKVQQAITRAEQEYTLAIEHNALVEAGLREGPTRPVPDIRNVEDTIAPFIPKAALHTFIRPADWVPKDTNWGKERWRAEDHYYVEELDYDG